MAFAQNRRAKGLRRIDDPQFLAINWFESEFATADEIVLQFGPGSNAIAIDRNYILNEFARHERYDGVVNDHAWGLDVFKPAADRFLPAVTARRQDPFAYPILFQQCRDSVALGSF